MNTRNTILKQIEEAEAAHKKTINNLRHEAYKAWVAEGGKERALEAAAIAKRLGKEKYKPANGLTIHGLRQAGVEVSVSHIRYADLDGENLMPVPSYLRKMYDFHPRGGATHITLARPDGKWAGVSSVCHIADSFDYKLGVKKALEQISKEEAEELMSGISVYEEEINIPVNALGASGPVGCACAGACGTCA